MAKEIFGISIAPVANISQQQNGIQISGLHNTPGNSNDRDDKYKKSSNSGISIAGLSNKIQGNFVGLQAAGISNFVDKDCKAIQVSTIGNYTRENFSGLQFAGLYNFTTDITWIDGFADKDKNRVHNGIQIGGLSNKVTGSQYGVQISGFINKVDNQHSGVQVAGVANNGGVDSGIKISSVRNKSDSLNGVGIAVISNVTSIKSSGFQFAAVNSNKEFSGVQFSGVGNYSEQMAGVQISLLANRSKTQKGVQIGLLNAANEFDGLQIGLINISNGKIRLPLINFY